MPTGILSSESAPRGYAARMAEDEPTSETLRIEQLQRELAERRRAGEAASEPQQRAAERRADRAAYLRGKLEQQAENPDDPA